MQIPKRIETSQEIQIGINESMFLCWHQSFKASRKYHHQSMTQSALTEPSLAGYCSGTSNPFGWLRSRGKTLGHTGWLLNIGYESDSSSSVWSEEKGNYERVMIQNAVENEERRKGCIWNVWEKKWNKTETYVLNLVEKARPQSQDGACVGETTSAMCLLAWSSRHSTRSVPWGTALGWWVRRQVQSKEPTSHVSSSPTAARSPSGEPRWKYQHNGSHENSSSHPGGLPLHQQGAKHLTLKIAVNLSTICEPRATIIHIFQVRCMVSLRLHSSRSQTRGLRALTLKTKRPSSHRLLITTVAPTAPVLHTSQGHCEGHRHVLCA